ncbi:MAG: ATP-binding protein [Cyanobacteriota bacterium]|nr:ATP-binding protein [Cyanobacteriota bacterium]
MLNCLSPLSYRSGDLQTYLAELVKGIHRLIQSDQTVVIMGGSEAGHMIASSPDLGDEITLLSLHNTLADYVIKSGQPLMIEDCYDCPKELPNCSALQKEYRAYLGVPLKTIGGVVLGTICSFQQSPRHFSEGELAMIESFAERAATAIENFQLYQHQQQLNEKLLQEVSRCLTNLKEMQQKLSERERLAAIGEFTAMIVHEIRNPLTTIEMGLRYAQRTLGCEAAQQRISLSLSESYRLNRLLQRILSYAKPQILQLSLINMGDFLDDILLLIHELPEAAERYISCVKKITDVYILADSDQLKQVFLNLFRNALEAISTHETVNCLIDYGLSSEWVCIAMHNGGDPVPVDLLDRLTTPFFSTKPSGTGLGLAISKQIVVAHGGELEIESVTSGTTVKVHLPVYKMNHRIHELSDHKELLSQDVIT